MKEGKLERIFYLTARTVGRAVAEKSLVDLRRAGLKQRAVTLTAKEKVCVREGHPCDPLTCPFACGYFDRVKPAIRDESEFAFNIPRAKIRIQIFPAQNASIRSYYLVMRTIAMLGDAWRQQDPIGMCAVIPRALEGEKPYQNLYQTALNLYIPVDAVSCGLLSKMQKKTSEKGRGSAYIWSIKLWGGTVAIFCLATLGPFRSALI